MATFYTIGHSTHPLPQFIRLLKQAAVTLLVDVRTVPRSRTNPQFNTDTLPDSLAPEGIDYRHIAELGGLRRHPRGAPLSANDYWENDSFRNYADYAANPAFQQGLQTLRALGREHCCAIMCSEAVWWRCHRRIIADYLLVAGEQVLHIMGEGRAEPARLNEAAVRAAEGVLVYPKSPAPDGP